MFALPLTTFLGLNNNFPGGTNSSDEVTLRELINLAAGGSGGVYAQSFPGGMRQVLENNFKKNAVRMIGASILIPIGFKVGTKLLRKPVIQPMNKLLKMSGLGNEVKV